MSGKQKMGLWGHAKDEWGRFKSQLNQANAGMDKELKKNYNTDANTVKETKGDDQPKGNATNKAETPEEVKSQNEATTEKESGGDGTKSESSKTTSNVDSQKEKEIDLYKNQLHDYEPYNYNITLACVSPSMFNIGRQFAGGEVILKSGGKPKQGGGALANDYYINNLVIRNTISPTKQAGLGTVYQVLFDVVEPYGTDFVDALLEAAGKMGYTNHLKAVYRLDIEFKGYDDDGKPSASTIPGTGRSIFLHFYSVELNVEAGVTTYQVQAVPAQQLAATEVHSILQESVTCKGKTVQEVVESFFDEYNLVLKQQQQLTKVLQPDEHVLKVIDSTEKLLKSPINYDINESETRTILNFSHTNVPDVPVVNVRQITVPKGTTIQQFLEEVIRASEFYQDQFDQDGEPKDANGFLQIGRIFNRMRILLADNGNNRPCYQFMYVLRTQDVSASYFDKQPVEAGIIAPTRVYNYIHTGANSDVLDFNLNYKFAYYQAIPYMADASSNDSGFYIGSDRPDGNPAGYSAPPSHANNAKQDISQITREVQDMDTDDVIVQNKHEHKEFSRIFEDLIKDPSADLIAVNMEILGDPCWIQHKGASNKSFKNTFVPETRNIDKHGSVQPDEYEQYIVLNYNPPVDIVDNLGLFKLKGRGSSWFSGRYKVFLAENRFADGVYTTVLEMVRARYQPTDKRPIQGRSNQGQIESANATEVLPLISIEFDGNNSSNESDAEYNIKEKEFEGQMKQKEPKSVTQKPEIDMTSSNVEKGNTFNIFASANNAFADLGPGNGKYNPDSPNYVEPKPGILQNKKGEAIKDSNGNTIRAGTA